MLKTISLLLQSFLIFMAFACSNAAEFAGQSGIKSQNSSTPETDSPIAEEPTPEELCTGADDFDSCVAACEEGSEECPLPPKEPVDEPTEEPGKGEDPTNDETCTDAEGNTEVNCINVTTTTEEPPTPTDENPAPDETTPGETTPDETEADTSCQDEEYANPEECPAPTENPSQNAAQNN